MTIYTQAMIYTALSTEGIDHAQIELPRQTKLVEFNDRSLIFPRTNSSVLLRWFIIKYAHDTLYYILYHYRESHAFTIRFDVFIFTLKQQISFISRISLKMLCNGLLYYVAYDDCITHLCYIFIWRMSHHWQMPFINDSRHWLLRIL